MAIRRDDFPLPDLAEPRTAPFFEAAASGRLALPRCESCGAWVWYPAEECPSCGGAEHRWTTTSGRGRLFAWTIVRRAFLPAFEDRVPFATGLVALEEAPEVRIVSYLVDCPFEALEPGLPMQAVFRPLRFATVPGREVTVPMFAPG